MSNPEFGQSPYQESTPEQLEKIDQVLDAYGETLRQIEEHGKTKLLVAQRDLFEQQLRDLRAELPIRPETDATYRNEVKKILAEAYQKGRLGSIAMDDARQEEGLTPEFWATEKEKKASRDHAPSPIEADEAVLTEIPGNEPAAETPEEVTETEPLELAKNISALDQEISRLFREMEDDILLDISDFRRAVNSMTTVQLKYLQLVNRSRGSYQNWEDTVHKAYPGSDLAIPETLVGIPVESLRDIVGAIRLKIGMLLRTRKIFLDQKPRPEADRE